ncbi:phospholipase domain-containing protein [Kitasatospora sp. CMC57]|uniref:phospholipase domain-containing protein n=1 Tax=Kitasatospora sp. CMC57 TaxID=3231513 RepID=UPI0038B5568B
MTAAVAGSALTLTLTNAGATPAYFAATPNDFGTPAQSVRLPPNPTRTLNWLLDQGRYDVTVTAATGTRFTQRYAGTLH